MPRRLQALPQQPQRPWTACKAMHSSQKMRRSDSRVVRYFGCSRLKMPPSILGSQTQMSTIVLTALNCPSQTLSDAQFKMMKELFNAPRREIFHSVVFCAWHKDRILSQGRRRGMQFPYWIELNYVQTVFSNPVQHPRPHRLRTTLEILPHRKRAEKLFWADAKARRLARMALAKTLTPKPQRSSVQLMPLGFEVHGLGLEVLATYSTR